MFKFDDLCEEGDVSHVVVPQAVIIKQKPWVDKYRPKKLDDIVAQDEIVKILKTTIATGELPHLLLYGPPGTGKTSTILAAAYELYGPNKVNNNVLELNASDERGISVVRGKIISFAKEMVGTADPAYPSPPYKIIILDEADAMTTEAQSALRKVIEEYSHNTRFCFICNYIHQIIDPVTSRCIKFRFKPLDDVSIMNKLAVIADEEKLVLDPGVLDLVVKIAEGDLRKGIMLMQNMNYSQQLEKHITLDAVCEIASLISQDMLNIIQEICFNKHKVTEIVLISRDMMSYGYPVNNILKQLLELVVNNPKLSDEQKASICLQIAETERRLLTGADELLQISSLMLQINSLSS